MAGLPRKCKICCFTNILNAKETMGGRSGLPLTALRERVAEALNVSLRTVSTISQACKSNILLQSPKKTKTRGKPVTNVDDFDQSAIRNVIHEMIKNRKYVSRKAHLQVLRQRDIFHGSISSLGVILQRGWVRPRRCSFTYSKPQRRFR